MAIGAAYGLTTCVPLSARQTHQRSIVLIHGTWHGGWCWAWLRPLLEAKGLRVFAPDLTGLGERADELGPDVGLENHIQDVVSLFEDNDLTDTVLVGHSYGGMVITGAAPLVSDRLSGLVYLDAVVPEPGDSMAIAGPDLPIEQQAGRVAAIRQLAPDGLYMPPLPPEAFGIPTDHPRRDWVADHLSAHPLKSWLDPLPDVGPVPSVPRTFIHCTAPVLQPSSIPHYAARAKASADWIYHEIQTGHDAMITEPGKLAGLLAATVTPFSRVSDSLRGLRVLIVN